MKDQQGFTAYELLAVALIATTLIAWCANLVKFIYMLDGGVTAMFIARIVGIFVPPVGVILGFF